MKGMNASSFASTLRSLQRRVIAVAAVCAALLSCNHVMAQESGPAGVSSFVSGLGRMKEANVDAQVLRTYVQSAAMPYRLSADEIIYLHQRGVDSELISAVIRRGDELRQQAFQPLPASGGSVQSVSTGAGNAPAPAAVQTTPSPVVVTTVSAAPLYPIYVEAYPDYLYPRYRYWPIYYRPSYWWPVASVYWPGRSWGYARGHDWIRPGVVNHINGRPSAGVFGGAARGPGGAHGGRRH